MKIKSGFSIFLFVVGSVLVALFAIDEIFLFLREANLLSMHIEEKVVIYLTLAPFLAALLYAMMSVFAKTKSFKQVIFSGGAGILLAVVETAAFYIITLLSLYYMVGAALIIAAIVLTIYGFGMAESLGSYGILCANAVYFTFNSVILAMSASSGSRALWAVILLPVLCALIIADMVSVSKIGKSKRTLQEAK